MLHPFIFKIFLAWYFLKSLILFRIFKAGTNPGYDHVHFSFKEGKKKVFETKVQRENIFSVVTEPTHLWKRTDLTSVTTSLLALWPAQTHATWISCGDRRQNESVDAMKKFNSSEFYQVISLHPLLHARCWKLSSHVHSILLSVNQVFFSRL